MPSIHGPSTAHTRANRARAGMHDDVGEVVLVLARCAARARRAARQSRAASSAMMPALHSALAPQLSSASRSSTIAASAARHGGEAAVARRVGRAQAEHARPRRRLPARLQRAVQRRGRDERRVAVDDQDLAESGSGRAPAFRAWPVPSGGCWIAMVAGSDRAHDLRLDRLMSFARTTTARDRPSAAAVARTWPIMLRPASGCSTLGARGLHAVPLPAASTTIDREEAMDEDLECQRAIAADCDRRGLIAI